MAWLLDDVVGRSRTETEPPAVRLFESVAAFRPSNCIVKRRRLPWIRWIHRPIKTQLDTSICNAECATHLVTEICSTDFPAVSITGTVNKILLITGSSSAARELSPRPSWRSGDRSEMRCPDLSRGSNWPVYRFLINSFISHS